MVSVLVGIVCLLARDKTPDATVQGVVDSLNKRDFKAVFSRFDGAKVDDAAAVMAKLVSSQRGFPKFLIKLETFTETGDTATGKVSVGYQAPNSTEESPYTPDEVHLKRTAGDWKIVDGNGKGSFFTQLGMISKDPSVLSKAQGDAKVTVVLSDMKQIALAVIMFTSDFDDKVAFDQSNMKAKLAPYLKNDKIWNDADGKPMDVRINPALVGKKMTSVSQPANCVLLSIGPKDKLVYVGGKTPIAFLDGHVKYYTKETISTVKWK